ncbi:hypothetical protein DPMN_178900 [Dreissena polymorpha]|uniref:Uncharacterized protein n=1 Tax=Dreissena polymorpha TaxID=45954 RepID=A0A9D4IN09_DREPO|nr:hypothetical protein DPMN_178900 [Dreissena polymorpha]
MSPIPEHRGERNRAWSRIGVIVGERNGTWLNRGQRGHRDRFYARFTSGHDYHDVPDSRAS